MYICVYIYRPVGKRAAGEAQAAHIDPQQLPRYSVYWLYWYKSTDTDATRLESGAHGSSAGTQFTCFTGTKVQILTLLESGADGSSAATCGYCVRKTCVPSTKVLALLVLKYLRAPV